MYYLQGEDIPLPCFIFYKRAKSQGVKGWTKENLSAIWLDI